VLEGIRIVELGVWVAGPSAGGLLAEWGADVVKVEPPAGDPMRRMFAVTAGHGAEGSPPFDLDNRGKRSVVLDLGTPDGMDAMGRLVATADVFLTNLRPEAVERLGLGAADLRARHPRLVYAQVTGYGTTGPEAHRAGYDVGAFWARSGIAATLVPDDQAPPGLRGGLGDHVTGVTTAAGILGALLARERTGEGTVVETSLLRTGIYCIGWDMGIQLRFGRMAPTVGRDRVLNPMVNCYRAADGRWFWLLGVEADRLWPKLVVALGEPAWTADERFADARGRRRHTEQFTAALDAELARRPLDEWAERFDAADVWWAPVNRPDDVVADAQAAAAGAFVDVPGGSFSGPHRGVATPVAFDDGSARPRGPTPALGEHTEEVLRELGLRP
jgi:crotonobetainyl-CoA:carnitine CoA-transferase CaiB-like acyl-CoA transferase